MTKPHPFDENGCVKTSDLLVFFLPLIAIISISCGAVSYVGHRYRNFHPIILAQKLRFWHPRILVCGVLAYLTTALVSAEYSLRNCRLEAADGHTESMAMGAMRNASVGTGTADGGDVERLGNHSVITAGMGLFFGALLLLNLGLMAGILATGGHYKPRRVATECDDSEEALSTEMSFRPRKEHED